MSTLEATQKIVATGAQEVADLEGKLAGIAQEIRDVQAELDQIPLYRTHRREQLDEAHQPLQAADAAHIQASTRAKWSLGTLGEDEAVKAVSLSKRALEAARKQYEQVKANVEKENATANAREQELRKHLAQLEAEQASRQAELQAAQSAHQIAHSELGQLKRAALLHGFEEKQRRVEELREELLSAQVELHDYHKAAQVELSDWPGLRKGFALLRRPDDATYRVLEATLHYADTLLADASHVRNDVQLPALRGPHSALDLWSRLLVLDGEVMSTVRRNPQQLQAKREVVSRLLEEYRDHLSGQE